MRTPRKGTTRRPGTPKMSRREISLNAEDWDWLDRSAELWGVSVPQVIRWVVADRRGIEDAYHTQTTVAGRP